MTQQLVPRDDLLVTDLADELILIAPDTGEAYQLNASARWLWQRLPADEPALLAAFAAHFALDAAQASSELQAIVGQWREAGLLAA